MRPLVKDFLALCIDCFDFPEPIYEFGALRVEGQEEFADLRPLFSGKQYIGADMRPGLGVDKVLNLHQIDLPDNTAGSVLCFDTLEHVEYPHQALNEIFRILKPGGLVVISSVMRFPIHSYPYDYWRFTPEAFRSLLKPFDECFVGYAGEEKFPHTVVGIGFKKTCPSLEKLKSLYERWRKRHEAQPMPALKKIRRLLLPPILSKKMRKMVNA